MLLCSVALLHLLLNIFYVLFPISMVTYSIAQRIFLVETFLLKKKSYDSTIHKFLRQFRGATMPLRQYISYSENGEEQGLF